MSYNSSSQHKEADVSFCKIENEEENVECFNYKDDSNIEEGEESILFEEIKLEPDNQLTDRYDENEYDIFAVDNEVEDEVTLAGDIKEEEQKYSLFEDVKDIVTKEENCVESFIVIDNVSYTSECEDEAEQTCSSSNETLTSIITDKKTLNTSVLKDVQDTEHYSTFADCKLNFPDDLRSTIKRKDGFCSNDLCNGSNLNSHNNCERKNKKYKCLKCHQTYSDKNCFKRHVNTAHREIIKFECNKCPKTFYCKDNLQAHIDVVHKGIIKFRCDVCHKLFSTQTFLQIHADKVHKNKVQNISAIDSNECRKFYEMFASQTKHMSVNHKRDLNKYECNYCHRMFAKECTIAKHINTVHKKKSQSSDFTQHFVS